MSNQLNLLIAHFAYITVVVVAVVVFVVAAAVAAAVFAVAADFLHLD